MRTLRLNKEHNAEELESKHPIASDAEQFIDRDTVVLARDGRLIAVLLRERIEAGMYSSAYSMWCKVNGPLSNRPKAVGVEPLPSPKKDGTLSPRVGVHKKVLAVLKEQHAAQGILGWDFKRGTQTKLTIHHPEMLDDNKRLIKRVDKLFKHYLPSVRAFQRAVLKTHPCCRIWHTAFSNIYIVKNLSTAYHQDEGNLPGGMTAIMCMGEFSGGELVLPRWRISFAYRPGDLLFFDAGQLHGNLPFEGERLSAAFYCTRTLLLEVRVRYSCRPLEYLSSHGSLK